MTNAPYVNAVARSAPVYWPVTGTALTVAFNVYNSARGLGNIAFGYFQDITWGIPTSELSAVSEDRFIDFVSLHNTFDYKETRIQIMDGSWTGEQDAASSILGSARIVCLDGVAPIAPVPEPETYAMLLAGLGVMGLVARRRWKTTV